ncbi:MAG TPA: TonB-dependent receptor plug domain-containing protein [Saprospiraceae bacterium]|nr:TonB-dependent receptor plug domain-containing protein [Saprospiraceae bacterium]
MRTILYILFSVFIWIKASASGDTLNLPLVNIFASPWQSYTKDRQIIRIDTLIHLNNTSSLKEVLPLIGLGYVKDYGPGNSATLTYQGTAPQHNQIVWNGIPINSSLLGLSDLSLMNIQSFQQIHFIPGTSSAYWGSGAIGSTLLIDNLSSKGNSISFGTSYNSLHNQSYNLTANYREKRFSSLLSGSLFNYLNRYSVIDFTSPKQEKRLFKNPMKLNDIQWTSEYKLNESSQLKLHVWNINSDRGISPSLTEVDHHPRQRDDVLRVVTEWERSKPELNLSLLGGFVNERIIYSDDAILDTGLVKSLFFQTNAVKIIHKYTFTISLQSKYERAMNSSFSTEHNRSVNSLALNITRNLALNTVIFVNTRTELINTNHLIQVASLSLLTELKKLYFKSYFSTSYNIPTFNDLYWVPGGNELLKPERGINAGLDIEYKKTLRKLKNSIGLNLFYHDIKDWIQWVPGSPYWRPVNYKRVISFGGNVFWNFNINIKRNQLKFFNSLQLTSSTNQEISEGSGSNILHKQLAYVPEYSFQNSIMYGFKELKIAYYQHWVGKRFTASDESDYLKPYFIANLQVEYLLEKNKLNYKPYIAVKNIFDASYESVAYRPREPRNISFGISIQIKSKNKEE